MSIEGATKWLIQGVQGEEIKDFKMHQINQIKKFNLPTKSNVNKCKKRLKHYRVSFPTYIIIYVLAMFFIRDLVRDKFRFIWFISIWFEILEL